MDSNLLLVHKSILPENYFLVIKARELIQRNAISVSEACLKVGISRNTYYKYKDYVFKPSPDLGKKAIISFKASDQKGVLSNILNTISAANANIITINQETPIQQIAYIIITINTLDLVTSLDELIDCLKLVDGVKAVNILAYE